MQSKQPNNITDDIAALTHYAHSKGFQMVAATFEAYYNYTRRLEPYYTLQADELSFCGTANSILHQLSNIPEGVV